MAMGEMKYIAISKLAKSAKHFTEMQAPCP